MASSLLSLPAELRWEIYQYCMTPPYPIDSQLERYKAIDSEPSSLNNNVHLHKLQRFFWSGAILNSATADKSHIYVTPQCQRPSIHFNLLQTCRQIHREFWPIYASMHAWHFTNPLKFANEFLFRLPPERLNYVRHLRINFDREPLRLGVDGMCRMSDVLHNIRNLSKVWAIYPELQQNIEEIEIVCTGQHYSHFDGGDTAHLDALIQNIVRMLGTQDINSRSPENVDCKIQRVGYNGDCELECCKFASSKTSDRSRGDDRFLIWCVRRQTNQPMNSTMKTLTIHIRPMQVKNWNKLPFVGSVDTDVHTIDRADFRVSHPNSLMDTRLKKNFWKLGDIISKEDRECWKGLYRILSTEQNWKVLFDESDDEICTLWLRAALKEGKENLRTRKRGIRKMKAELQTVAIREASTEKSEFETNPKSKKRRRRKSRW